MTKLLLTFSIALLFVFTLKAQGLYNYNAVTISGDTIPLSQYAGKKLMIVNTASFCGYTPQFTQLQQVYQQYHISNNFEILGFPCNDFGNQDPGSDSAALSFCTNNYNVTFQMMSHVNITSDTTDIYRWLQQQNLNGVANAPITWNFHKFLIDETGHWVAHYPSQTLPNATAIVNWITSPNITDVENLKQSETTFNYSPDNSQITIKNNNNSANNNSAFQIKLFSLEGKLIDDISNKTSQLNYSTSNLPNGIYLAYVQNASENKTFKFVISR